jgi:aminoglycoside 2''-phosphotransferase
MSLRDDYVETLRSACLGLEVRSASLNREGQNADVLIVNDAWIFRFPRYDEGVSRLQTEAAILRGLAGKLPLPVPEPGYVHLSDQPPGDAFLGYRMLPGRPLWPDDLLEIEDGATVTHLAHSLGGFLRALHGIDYAAMIDAELDNADTLHSFRAFYRRIRQELFEWMRPRVRTRIERLFTAYLADERHFEFRPVLRHGDFGSSNILYDRRTCRLTGIVDFGSAAVGDPAYDVAGLLASYGEEFVEASARTYPQIEGFMARVEFYQQTFALEEALFGVENDDEAAFRAGMATFI